MNSNHSGMRVCPRCGGNMFLHEDHGEVEEACLQCGHRNYLFSRYQAVIRKPAEWDTTDSQIQPERQNRLNIILLKADNI